MGRSSRYIPVRAIRVSLWNRTVGAIVPYSAGYCAFEYDAGFLKSGLEIAPLKMPLANGAGPYVFNDFGQGVFMGLPGVFADSLPDGFGNTLINEYLRRQGIGAESITALDRLAYIGARGMGALCYEPERNPHGGKPLALNMRELTEEARKVLNGSLEKMSGNDALRSILRVGVSAGGGKAKAVVGWNRETDQFLAGDRGLPDGFEHWIVKFTPPEYPYRGRCEYEIMQKARAAGIETSECRLFELDGIEHFMTKRFDRDGQNLYVEIPVSPVTAALGGVVTVPTPEGDAQLKIPPGTPNGKVFRLRGKGVPSLRGGMPGDLDARIVLETPGNLDRRQREALESLKLGASNFPESQRFASKEAIFSAHREKMKRK